MKRFLTVLLAVVLTASMLVFSAGAADGITVILDGNELSFDVPPQIINGRTMVPIRAIFEALGAEVKWDDTTKTVTATIDDYVVKCRIDNRIMDICGERITMDVCPVIVDGRTLMPARFAAEAFGCSVGWAAPIKTAYIVSYGYNENEGSKGDQ